MLHSWATNFVAILLLLTATLPAAVTWPVLDYAALREAGRQPRSYADLAQAMQQEMLGNCTQKEIEDLAREYGSPEDTECVDPVKFCQPQCLDPMVKALHDCDSLVGIEIMSAECGSNRDGQFCLSVLLPSMQDILTGSQTCPTDDYVDHKVEGLGYSMITVEGGSTTCTDDCKLALEAIKDNFGCCFGNFYNTSSKFFTKYLSNPAVKSLSRYQLWESCGVDTVGTCHREINLTKNLIAVDLTLNFTGLISSESEKIMEEILGGCDSEEFDSKFDILDNVECETMEKLCQPRCMEPLLEAMKECRSAQDRVTMLKSECGSNEKGQICQTAVLSSLEDIMGLGYCPTDGSYECSSDCKQALLKIKEHLGCCYGNMYNNSAYSTQDTDRAIFANVSSYRLWQSCGVETVGECLYETQGFRPKLNKHPNFPYGILIGMLVLVCCAIAVVAVLQRRRLTELKRFVSIPKVPVVKTPGYTYHKLPQGGEAGLLEDDHMQTEL